MATDHATHVRVRELTKTFASGTAPALDGVSLDIRRGHVMGLVGYSGAGKSTLIRMLNAIETPTSGTVHIGDVELTALPEAHKRALRARIGMVFQHFNLFASRTVAGNIAYPLKLAGVPQAKRAARVAELLEFVGLSDKARVFPRRLSGGQKQRVGIARALASDPELLLADEPTSALDPTTTAEVLQLLRKVRAEFGTTIVVVTHEMTVVRDLCDDVTMMQAGQVVETGPTYQVFSAPQHPTTRAFAASIVPGAPNADTLLRLVADSPPDTQLAAIDINVGCSGDIVHSVLQAHGVVGTVVHGGITEICQLPLGTLTYRLRGPACARRDALAELAGLTQVTSLSAPAEAVVSGV